MNKYYAKYVFWNTVTETVVPSELANSLRSGKQNKLPQYIRRFDSQHEFKVYLELVRIYGNKHVRNQVSVSLLPAGDCFPRGKNWRVDFAITDAIVDTDVDFYVEAKGIVTREFTYTLACLEQHKPKIFNNLYLVFPNAIPTENAVIKNLCKTKFKERIITLKELKQAKKLS